MVLLLILQIQTHHINLLKQETEKMHPLEACAMLFGNLLKNKAIVEKVEIVPNRLRSTTRFEVDPEKVAAAIKKAEMSGLEFIGLFHSHPAPAIPSLIDKKFIKLWGDAIWLILSTTNSNLAAYQLIKNNIKKVTIEII